MPYCRGFFKQILYSIINSEFWQENAKNVFKVVKNAEKVF